MSCAGAVVTAIPQPRRRRPGASSNTSTSRLASVRDSVHHSGTPAAIEHGRARSPRRESVSAVALCRGGPPLSGSLLYYSVGSDRGEGLRSAGRSSFVFKMPHAGRLASAVRRFPGSIPSYGILSQMGFSGAYGPFCMS